jgi:hypothetical protein
MKLVLLIKRLLEDLEDHLPQCRAIVRYRRQLTLGHPATNNGIRNLDKKMYLVSSIASSSVAIGVAY